MKLLYHIIFLFLLLSSAKSADTLFVDDAVKILLENNFAIRLSQKSLEIADNNTTMGNAGMLPSVDASASYNHNINDVKTMLSIGEEGARIPNETLGSISKNTALGVQMNWTMFDGLNMFISYDRLKALKEKSEIDLQIAVQNMLRQFYAVYFQAVTLKKNLVAQEESVKLSLLRLERLVTKEQYGAAVKLELLKAKVDLNTDSTNYLRTKLQYDNAKRDINFLLARNNFENFEVQDDIKFDNLPNDAVLRERIFSANTSINQALKNKEISVYDKRRIQSTLFPRIVFNMGYSYSKQESDGGFLLLNQTDGFKIGLNAQMNLFNGMQTSSQIQNAEILKMMNDISIEQIRAQIALEYDKNLQNYNQSLEILNKEEENLNTARLSYNRTNELYELGQITSIELREAQRNLLLSEFRLNDARFQVKLAETELLLLSNSLIK